jgi:nucleotide-binding universal stress UspA family protein
MKVLVAVDGSEFGNAAVEEVAGRGWPAGTMVRVLSAAEEFRYPSFDSWVMPDHYHKEVMEVSRAKARQVVDAAAARLGEAFGGSVTVETDVVEGEAKQVILDAAAAWEADLVVVGSHGYGTFERLLLGSVSNAVAQHADCSVLIVRDPALMRKKEG